MGRQTPHPGTWCHLTVSSCIWHFHFPSSPHSSLTVWVLFSVHNANREWQNTNTSSTTHFICCTFYQNYIGGSTAGPWKERLRFNWRWPYATIIQDKALGVWLVLFCLFCVLLGCLEFFPCFLMKHQYSRMCRCLIYCSVIISEFTMITVWRSKILNPLEIYSQAVCPMLWVWVYHWSHNWKRERK